MASVACSAASDDSQRRIALPPGRRPVSLHRSGREDAHAGQAASPGRTFDPVTRLSGGVTLVQEAMEMSILVGYASKPGGA